jgi:hypothetical protein
VRPSLLASHGELPTYLPTARRSTFGVLCAFVVKVLGRFRAASHQALSPCSSPGNNTVPCSVGDGDSSEALWHGLDSRALCALDEAEQPFEVEHVLPAAAASEARPLESEGSALGLRERLAELGKVRKAALSQLVLGCRTKRTHCCVVEHTVRSHAVKSFADLVR